MAKNSRLDWIRSQLTTLPPVYHVDLRGQTVVVTGSNIGLGLEAAKYFARMNPANLIIAVRSKSKGDAALAGTFISPSRMESRTNFESPEIQMETGYTGGKVMILDLGDFASVSSFVTAFEKDHDRLDVLVCNAGVGTLEYDATKNGWESTYVAISLLSGVILSLLFQNPS
jgi:retinol dehydrogenase 12